MISFGDRVVQRWYFIDLPFYHLGAQFHETAENIESAINID